MKTKGIHPEVRKEVIKEYARLRRDHPNSESSKLLEMSIEYVRALCYAETQLLKEELFK